MSLFRKVTLALIFLLVSGLARMPLERPLAREMRTANILAEPLDAQTSQAIGQTSAAIALGGLRSLVAAVLNFSKVLTAWQNQDWLHMFNTFQQIHTLQPKTAYYWEAAAAYAADDGYSDYGDRIGVPESQRALRRDEFFNKGISYLDQGIENLPENLSLRKMKARILSDPYKPEHLDLAAATRVLDEAVKLDSVTAIVRRTRLYHMSRVPSRRREALTLARELYADPTMRLPTLQSTLFTLQKEFPDEQAIPDLEIYRSEARLIRSLYNHSQRTKEGYPSIGIKKTLERYLAPMQLPYALNPLENDDIKRITPLISSVLSLAPFKFPPDPFTKTGDWPLVIEHFEEFNTKSLPTMRVLYLVYQNLTSVETPPQISMGQIFPDKLVAIRDLANFLLDDSHQYPRVGVSTAMSELCNELNLPNHLSPTKNPALFPLTDKWLIEVRDWQIQELNRN